MATACIVTLLIVVVLAGFYRSKRVCRSCGNPVHQRAEFCSEDCEDISSGW